MGLTASQDQELWPHHFPRACMSAYFNEESTRAALGYLDADRLIAKPRSRIGWLTLLLSATCRSGVETLGINLRAVPMQIRMNVFV